MHKKLAADLTSLAHSILQMKNKDDVFALKEKAYEVYEKLAVLAYVEEYINNTPNPEHTKEELIEKIENVIEEVEGVEQIEDKVHEEEVVELAKEIIKRNLEEESQEKVVEPEQQEEEIIKHNLEDAVVEQVEEVQEEVEEIVEEVEVAEEPQEEAIELVEETLEEVEEPQNEVVDIVDETPEEIAEPEVETTEEVQEELVFELAEEPKEKEIEKKTPSLEEELQDTIAVDVVADLFENAPKKSLNDKLHGDIQIGLNDRIAFVKNLFDGSQEDFNRVVSQLNTFKTEKEAKKFINKMVKPDYNWTEKEEFEERFMAIVERKFV